MIVRWPHFTRKYAVTAILILDGKLTTTGKKTNGRTAFHCYRVICGAHKTTNCPQCTAFERFHKSADFTIPFSRGHLTGLAWIWCVCAPTFNHRAMSINEQHLTSAFFQRCLIECESNPSNWLCLTRTDNYSARATTRIQMLLITLPPCKATPSAYVRREAKSFKIAAI